MRLKLLASASFAASLVFVPIAPAFASTTACGFGAISTGTCLDSANTGSSVTLSGRQSTATGGGGSSTSTITGRQPANTSADANTRDTGTDGYFDCSRLACHVVITTDTERVENAPHVVTLSDLADFRPGSGTVTMEPDGWTAIGLDTNFYSSARAQVIAGALLGARAEVRFSPVAWHWDYGDGGTRDTTTGGASWKALHDDEFARTATSHVFSRPDSYTIDLAVDFGVEYRFAGGEWTRIDGVVTAHTPPISAVAGSASTVLVGAGCSARSAGPGC